MTDTEFCTKCNKNVDITYIYEDTGDCESGPMVQVKDVKISCGHNPTDLMSAEMGALVIEVTKELKNHDWWHSMSDSNSVHFAGQRHMEKIKEMLAKLPLEMASTLYNFHKPDQFVDYSR